MRYLYKQLQFKVEDTKYSMEWKLDINCMDIEILKTVKGSFRPGGSKELYEFACFSCGPTRIGGISTYQGAQGQIIMSPAEDTVGT